FGVKALVSVKTFADLAQMKWLSVLVNALAAAGDIYITAVLSVLLYNSKTGFQRSDAMITRLIKFAVNTGLLTTCCAIGSLISICAAPTTFLYIGFFFTIGRLYANSLLCTLNARSYIRSTGEDYNSTDGINNMFASRDAGTGRPSHITGVSIHIDTMHKYDTDRDLEKGVAMRGPEEVEMSPVGKAGCAHDFDRASEHGHGTSFCDMDDSDDIEKRSTNQSPQCLVRQHHCVAN
ncbi:hypothetical protein V5O48_013953, partial [Marasmius crinis-equi]